MRAFVLAVSIAACLLSVECGPATPTGALPVPRSGTPASARPSPQLCVSGATTPSDHFALVHGCITYTDGSKIWAVDPNHPANRISLGPSNGRTPIAWSRDGSRLLLVERRNAGTAQEAKDLYVMNADGSQIRLTSDGNSAEGSFSPDGARVVFSRQDDGLYVVDVKGGAPRLIAKSYLAWWLATPSWSPDGSRIAYTVYVEGGPGGLGYRIWTVNPDGTGQRQFIDLGECRANCAGGLAWSADGSRLAFHSAHRTQNPVLVFGIYVANADGSGLHRVNDNGTQPFWSPDGSRLGFILVDRTTTNGPWGGQLFTMAADGSDQRQVEGVGAVIPFGSVWTWNPVK